MNEFFKKFIKGIGISFLSLIASWIIYFIFLLTPLSIYLIFILSAIPLIYSQISGPIILSFIFILINFTAYQIKKEDIYIKKGIKYGYILLILFFIPFLISRYQIYQFLQIYKAIENRDATFCNKVKNQNLANDCFWGIADKTKDKAFCDKIINDYKSTNPFAKDKKERCYKMINSFIKDKE